MLSGPPTTQNVYVTLLGDISLAWRSFTVTIYTEGVGTSPFGRSRFYLPYLVREVKSVVFVLVQPPSHLFPTEDWFQVREYQRHRPLYGKTPLTTIDMFLAVARWDPLLLC